MLSASSAKALTIVYHAGRMASRTFGRRMWPDSLIAGRTSGAFLGRLRKQKLLSMGDDGEWFVTAKGIAELEKWLKTN